MNLTDIIVIDPSDINRSTLLVDRMALLSYLQTQKGVLTAPQTADGHQGLLIERTEPTNAGDSVQYTIEIMPLPIYNQLGEIEPGPYPLLVRIVRRTFLSRSTSFLVTGLMVQDNTLFPLNEKPAVTTP